MNSLEEGWGGLGLIQKVGPGPGLYTSPILVARIIPEKLSQAHLQSGEAFGTNSWTILEPSLRSRVTTSSQ
jgi:hypothetical protein